VAALAKKHDSIYSWALKHDCPFDVDVCPALAKRGSIEMLDATNTRVSLAAIWTAEATAAAAAAGHVHVLRWLLAKACIFDVTAAVAAATRIKGGGLEMLRVCVEEAHVCCSAEVAMAAAKRGDIAMLDYIAAAEKGAGEVLLESMGGPGSLSARLGPRLREFSCGAFGLSFKAAEGDAGTDGDKLTGDVVAMTGSEPAGIIGGSGAVVLAITPGSRAAALHVREGARLTEINGAPMNAMPLAEVLAALVASGEGAPLRMLLRQPPRLADEQPTLCSALCKIAVERNNPVLLNWALAHGVKPEKGALYAAAIELRLSLAKQLVAAGCKWPNAALAVAYGRHNSNAMLFIRWAVLEGGAVIDDDEGLGRNICNIGDAKALRWAFERGCPLPSGCARAAALGDLDLLKELRAAYTDEDDNEAIVDAAARHGHDHVLAWAVDKGMRVDETTIEAAASMGHLGTIQLLRSMTPECRWDSRTWAAAAGRGTSSVHMFQWLRYKLCPKPAAEDENAAAACTAAAEKGDIKSLRWLREESPPFAFCDETCIAAANLETLQWLRAQVPPCPISREVCEAACDCGDEATLRWLAKNGCDCSGDFHPTATDEEEGDE
jgi:hypothetical protein